MRKYAILPFDDLFNRVLYGNYTKFDEDVDMMFQSEGEVLYILFEQTSSKLDWKHNFAFKKKPYKDMLIPYYVHRGFLKCWKVVEDLVISEITKKDDSGNYIYSQIICGGWSHGGALTVFAHECVWYHRPDIRDACWSVSFDGPRVYGGFKVKKTLCERWSRFYQIVNDSDIVTKVPPKLFGFTHVGNILHIGRHVRYGMFKSHYDSSISHSLQKSNIKF